MRKALIAINWLMLLISGGICVYALSIAPELGGGGAVALYNHGVISLNEEKMQDYFVNGGRGMVDLIQGPARQAALFSSSCLALLSTVNLVGLYRMPTSTKGGHNAL